MSLLAKRFSINKILKPGLIMLIPVFFGCDTSEDIGIQYDLGSDANVRFQEFTLPASNIYIDSLRTDGEGRVLVGNYADPLTGNLSTEGYLQYTYINGPLPRELNTADEISEDTLKLDSIIITFESSATLPQEGGIFFQEFSLYDLQDSLEATGVYLSSNQQTPVELAGTFSANVNTLTDTIYRIKLENDYALSFFQNLSDIAGDTTRFIGTTVFKSLGLIPGPASEGISNLIFGSDTSRLIVYTSPVLVRPELDTTYVTTFAFSGKNYTYVERDRSTSEFASIAEFENFDLASGETVIDPLAGISVAFSIEQLQEFFEENRSILINSASVSFDFRSETDRDTLTSFMNFFRKRDGKIFGPAVASNSFGSLVMSDNGYLSGQVDPVLSFLNEDRTEIVLNPTLFYQQIYQEYIERDSLVYQNPADGALITLDDLVGISLADVTLQRAIIENGGIKLRLYYTEVER